MSARPLPARDKLTVCFAHVAYRMGERFALRNTGLDWFEVRSLDDLKARIKGVELGWQFTGKAWTCCCAPACGGMN